MSRRVRTTKIGEYEFCNYVGGLENQELSLARVFVPVIAFLVIFGGLGLFAVYHKDPANDMLKWVGMGTAIFMMLLFFGARIYKIVQFSMEVRSQLPEDAGTAYWVNCGSTRGWLTEKDGWLVFYSKPYCFKLSRNDFANLDQVRRWGWIMSPAQLRLPPGMPEMKVSLVPVFGNKRRGLAFGFGFRQWIEQWLARPVSEGKSLFPPISREAHTKSTLDYALKFLVLDVVVSLGVGFLAFIGASSAPEAAKGQTAGQGALTAFLGCFCIFTVLTMMLVISYAITNKQDADARKITDRSKMTFGEREL